MPRIRPISDLRNHFTDIAKLVNESDEPVFLTKNGYGIMVVMSMEAYEKKKFESEHYQRIKDEEVNNRKSYEQEVNGDKSNEK